MKKRSGWKNTLYLMVCVVLASGIQLAILLLTKNYDVYLFGSLLFAIPLMVWSLEGKTSMRPYCKSVFWSFLIAIVLGGCVTAVENLFRFRQIPIWIAILCVIFAKKGICVIRQQWKRQKRLETVILVHKDKRASCLALWDTGNQLKTDEDGRPIHIISMEIFHKLEITANDFVGVIGYCALGNTGGILPLYEIDNLYMETSRQKEMQNTKVVVACATSQLLSKRTYQVILNVEGVHI